VHRRPPLSCVAAAALALPALAGCSGRAPEVTPAPSAGSSACTAALRHAPARVLGEERTPLGVTGAAAWGRPAVVLRCGLPEPGPTSLPCLSVNGTDWVVDDSGDPLVFTTFGRSPAVEVSVPASYGRTDAPAALVDVAAVAAALPRTPRRCLG
jgi:hypothetical protein